MFTIKDILYLLLDFLRIPPSKKKKINEGAMAGFSAVPV